MNSSFRPVRGIEAKIPETYHDGYVYFVTDSGKIYMDTATGRYSFGANGAAVLYANADNVTANSDDSYTILYSYLDDQHAIPKAEDLVINTDGRFFRVNYYDANSGIVNCKLIAVSGNGNGNNTGPGPDNTDDPKAIKVTYNNLVYSFLNGRDYNINLTALSQVDQYLNISYSVKNSSNYTTGFGSIQIKSGASVNLPVGQYITPDGGFHMVDITIQGANSYQYSGSIKKIRCVDLKVESAPDKFTCQKVYESTVPYYVRVYGQIAKTLYVSVDDKPLMTKNLEANDDGTAVEILIDCQSLGLVPGVHTVSAYLETDGVPSNTVMTDFIYHPSTVAPATYVIVTEYPTECMSYETPAVYYWVYNTAQTDGYKNTISLIVDGVTIADDISQAQKEGESLRWNVTGLKPDARNICEISCGGSSRTFEIYCHYSGIFEPTADGSVLMLSAEGRSNSTSLERRLEWKCTNSRGNDYYAILNNFNWNNNGWITDEQTGRDCLRISNGASVEIPLQLFPNGAPSTGGFTFEFEFKPYNLYSYNLLTLSTTTIEDETNEDDDAVEILREFDASRAVISYIDTDNDGKACGMCCGTQDAFFRMSDGKNVTVRYTNDRVVNVAISINAAKEQICMYVNGVMSGMVAYNRDSAKLPIGTKKLLINSDQCDLDLYNVRIYDQALTSRQVVQNYIANTKNMDVYKQNVFNADDDTVSLAALQDYNEDNPSNATIPYMIFKTKSPDILPYNKANEDVVCSIEFVNPALDYALAKGDINEVYYKKHAPSFTADEVTLNVQGTSSQKYPRKNFKGKFKNAKNWQCREASVNNLVGDKSLSKFYMNESIAEKTICWKADYMDSSSCHNTGFASYAQELYWNHPLDYYEGTNVAAANKEGRLGTYRQKYRTSLYGFPVLAFHQKSDGTTEFIGRYNFNLDKGADDTLGMAEEKVHPVVKGTFIEKNKDGTTSEKPMDYAHVCECWEMANNMGGRCSFRGNPFDYCYDYNYKNADGTVGAYIVNGQEGQSDIGDDIEVRYHINDKAIEGAWDNLTKPLEDGGTPISSREAFEVLLGGDAEGNNRTGAYAHLERLYKWLQSCYYAFDMDTEEDRNWANGLAKTRARQEVENNIANTFATNLAAYRAHYAALPSLELGSMEYKNKLKELTDTGWYVIRAAALTERVHYTITTKRKEWEDGSSNLFDEINILITDEELTAAFTSVLSDLDNYQIRTDANGNYYARDGQPVDLFYKMIKDVRKTKFENEFDKHLNKEYCTVYYILTELLLQYDSRGKNMMISSWGPMEEFQKDKNGDFILDENGEKIPGEYIWFPIYYDVDTQLGVNNSGIPSWEYNVEPTTGFNNANNKKAFSTANSLLWNNFHQSFAIESKYVQDYYKLLRGSTLTIAKINGYYNFDYNISNAYCMKGILPISIMNANQNYKYIAPSTEGYIIGVDEAGAPLYRTTSAYFYCLQGTRELHRAQLLRNRFNYYDSKWMAQDYQPGTGGSAMRWRANAYSDPQDESLRGHLTLQVKPALDQYLVLWPDESATYVVPVFARGGETATIDLMQLFSSGTYQQQLIYIGGYKYLQEFGDVSLLYLDEFEFPDDANNITKIQLGNENPRYRPDDQFKVSAIDEATSQKPLLKVFDITNIDKINSKIRLADSVKLETFKALGTKITGATFANGVNLHHLYLPNTVTSLALNKASNLTRVIYNPADLKTTLGDDTEGLYIEDLVKEENGRKTTNISEIDIVGGNLQLYGYDLLNKVTEAVGSMIPTNEEVSLSINMEDVKWTPYTQLGEGAIYESSNSAKYKYATNNYSYENYNYTNESKWKLDLLNGRVYEYAASPIAPPVNLDLLDTFLNQDTKIDESTGKESPKHYTNITDTLIKDLPVITGELYIDNSDHAAISEADIANLYNVAFPSLSIRAAKINDAYRARFVRLEKGIEDEIKVLRFDPDDDDIVITPPAESEISAPSHYDFKGWTDVDPSGVEDVDTLPLISDFSQFTFEDESELVFYAIYKKHEYDIYFHDLGATGADAYEQIVPVTYGLHLFEPTIMPYRGTEEAGLELEERLTFKGWTDQEDKAGLVGTELLSGVLVDVTSYTADRNYHFYAVFSRESVYSSPSDEKYFDYDYNFNYSDATGYTTTGTLIKINNNYRTQDGPLKGKLTVPKVDNYGNPIIGITGFDGVTTKNVTHIFFMEDNDIVTFTEAAFAGGMESKLKYIDFKHLTKLRNIGTRAMELLPNLEFTEIPKSVVQIKNGAITGAFSNISNIPAFSIGGRVVKMDGKALSYCNTKIGTYIIGGPEDPSQLSLDDWFATKVPYITQNQKQRPTLVKIYCKPERVNEFELALKEFRQGEGHSFITIASESTGDEVTGSYQIIETTEKGAE